MCVCGGGADLHVKDRIKTIEVQEKKLEEADKVGGGSDYSCAGLGEKKGFASNQRADLLQIS